MKVAVINPFIFEVEAELTFDEGGLIAYKENGVRFEDGFMYIMVPACIIAHMMRLMDKNTKKFYKKKLKACESPIDLLPLLLGEILEEDGQEDEEQVFN